MFRIPGYDITDRTRLTLVVPDSDGGAPKLSLAAPSSSIPDVEAQLDHLQLAYLRMRNRAPEDGARYPIGMIYDEAGQHIARVGADGGLWAVRSPGEEAQLLRDAPDQPALEWENCGDKSPRQGTVLFNFGAAEFDTRGFTVPAIAVTPETDIGGSDKVFELRQGESFLGADNYASALELFGATLADGPNGPRIIMPGHDGDDLDFAMDSEPGMRILAGAAHAYSGIEDVHVKQLVSIGLPDITDQPRKFPDTPVYYRSGSSLWAIMSLELSGFSDVYPDEVNPYRAEAIPEDLLTGMPADLGTRADLAKAAAFSDLERDDAGNPLVWRNHYIHEDCEQPEDDHSAPSWDDEWSCQCDDECYCCGLSISPTRSTWIGPDDPDLREAWEDLPEADEPASPTMSL